VDNSKLAEDTGRTKIEEETLEKSQGHAVERRSS